MKLIRYRNEANVYGLSDTWLIQFTREKKMENENNDSFTSIVYLASDCEINSVMTVHAVSFSCVGTVDLWKFHI